MGDFIPHIFVIMKFKLIDNLKFVNVDLNYLEKLREISDDILHIISAIDIKKMIPIKDSVIKEVNINFDENDTIDEKHYKDLLQNEYNFCVGIIDDIIIRANKVYDKQINKKNGLKFCCDFKALEKFVSTLS